MVADQTIFCREKEFPQSYVFCGVKAVCHAIRPLPYLSISSVFTSDSTYYTLTHMGDCVKYLVNEKA